MSRGGFKVSRNGGHDYVAGERVSWIDQFANNIEVASGKTAVEVARTRSQQSIMDQINAIMNGKNAHTTVESKVQDLQERLGLKEYLNKLEAKKSGNEKTASEDSLFPNVEQGLKDEIISYIKNSISTHRGRIHVPAVQEAILSTFKNKGVSPEDIDDSSVAKFISDVISSELKLNPSQDLHSAEIGRGVGVEDVESDSQNSDFFHGLLPEKEF